MNDPERFVFLIPDLEAAAVAAPEGDADLARHGDVIGFLKRSKEVAITSEQLANFWKEKVVGLTQTLTAAEAEKQTKGFHVDEITFSIGVGAKGGIFFVAEGSVEASLSVTLRRTS